MPHPISLPNIRT
jgi:hypothetical protein